MRNSDSKEEVLRRDREAHDLKQAFMNCKWSNKTKSQNGEANEELLIEERQAESMKTKIALPYPVERWGHQAFTIGKFMYLVGGYIQDGYSQVTRDQLYRFDCESFEWERIASISPAAPERRDSASSCLIQNKALFFGGKTPDERVKNDLWALDLSKTKPEWKKIEATGQSPPARESHQACSIDDRFMFVFGGTNGKEDESFQAFDDMHLFDSLTNCWREITNKHGFSIEARDSFSMVTVGDFVYIFGGQGKSVGKTDIFYNDFYKLKMNFLNEGKTETLEILPVYQVNDDTRPCERASHSTCILRDRFIFIIGGENAKQKLDDIWVFDIKENLWAEVVHKKYRQPYLRPMISHSSSIYKDNIVIFGGLKENDLSSYQTLVLTFNDLEAYLGKNPLLPTKKICDNCEIVFNLKLEQQERAKQLENTLKNFQSLDEDNIRIDVDREREAAIHPEVFIEENGKKIPTLPRDLIEFPKQEEDIEMEAENSSRLITKQEQIKDEDENQESTIQKVSPKQKGENTIVEESSAKEKKELIQVEEQLLHIRQPFISISFMKSIANLLTFPHAAFGLLVHNAKDNQASAIEINLMYCNKGESTYPNITQLGSEPICSGKTHGILLNQETDATFLETKSLFYQIYDDSEGFAPIDFIDILFRLDDTKKSQKASYGNNLKLAGLRLGQSVLIISKNRSLNVLSVGLISSNGKVNPNLQECIVFMFSIDLRKKSYLTESGDQNKRIIMNIIAHLMNEDQLFRHDKGNHIYIFDLKRIPSVSVESYEFQYCPSKHDIFAKKASLFKDKKNQVENLIDYSLSSFLSYLYLEQQNGFSFAINGQKKEFISYRDTLVKQKNAQFIKELQIEADPMVKDIGTITVFEISENSQKQEVPDKSINQKSSTSDYLQGILLYQNSRLIGRAESNHFGSNFIDSLLLKSQKKALLFQYVGFIQLDKSTQPNLFNNGLDSTFQEATIKQSLKYFLKKQFLKEKARKSEGGEESKLRKQLKTD